MLLNLGVIDLPYQAAPSKVAKAKKGKANKPRSVKTGEQSTGDVAHWLENKYGVMQGFVNLHMPEIAASLEDSVAGAIESLMQGAPPRHDVFGTATSKIETLFKFTYLDKEEIVQTGAQGVPTEAAKRRVNHRLKLNRGAKRPSFIDTGLYQSSFKSWME